MADCLPLIPGSDGAGLVAEVGPGVRDLTTGQAVVIFPLREAPTAHRRMDEGQQFGKIVLIP